MGIGKKMFEKIAPGLAAKRLEANQIWNEPA